MSEPKRECVFCEAEESRIRTKLRECKSIAIIIGCLLPIFALFSFMMGRESQKSSCEQDPTKCHIGVSSESIARNFISTITVGFGEDTGSFPDVPYEQNTIDSAVHEWEIALGRKVKTPKIVFGWCSTSAAIACADRSRYSIHVVRTGGGFDAKTILMHEIGHLLGAPHIVDDPLMDPWYSHPVDHPTPDAIAIARSKE